LKSRQELKKLADMIVQSGERGAELTQRLLAYGRRQTLNPVDIDCNSLVSGMRKLLRRTLTEDVEIKVSLDPELATAFADSGQLENAILNLVINAKDAMPNGGTISITTANKTLDERYAEHHPEVDPADYIMVHKEHYADLLYRATPRIEIEPLKISVDCVLTENTSTVKHGD